jgi:membrane protein DedA with SNARE-associated domain
MEAIAPYLAFVTAHIYAFAFVVAMIDASGLPFPGRLLLIVAGTLSVTDATTTWVVVMATAGTVVGDHALYLLGRLGGAKLLDLYCRWTMGSGHCVRRAHDYFRRFGGLTIVIGRFVAGVRLFASVLAGSGAIPYHRFLLFDVLGALLWAAAFVLFGYFLGGQAIRLMERYGGTTLVAGGVVVLVIAGIVVYRLWRRRRHGTAAVARDKAPRRAA